MIARRPLPAWAEIAVLPLVNIALAFVTVGIIVRIVGVDPLQALRLLVVSVELDEILSLADRILVMFAGRIVGEVESGRADERTLGLMMAGAKAA